METLSIIIGLLILFILVCVLAAFALRHHIKSSRDSTFVHIKTGNKYAVYLRCKIKQNGNWTDGIIYHKLGDIDTLYVRDEVDFITSFMTLEQWEEEHE